MREYILVRNNVVNQSIGRLLSAMSLLSTTIDHLFLHIKTSSLDMSELRNELQQILQQATRAPREDLDGALQRLEELVGSLPLLPAALIALGCGALVEYGGSPSAVIPVIFRRTGEALQRAASFVSACKEAARAQPSQAAENEDAEQCVETYGEQVSQRMPEEARAWSALPMLFRVALAILMGDARARQLVRDNISFTTALKGFPVQNTDVVCIHKLLQILEHEVLIILHPGLRRGYRVRINGIGDNFQLHTLLADALIGDPTHGWLPGERPDPIVVAAAKDGPCPRTVEENQTFPVAQGAFNLWNWQGLQADGTLPTPGTTQSRSWIWNEGTPADISLFEGSRVILLGPPPYARTWSAGRSFPSIAGQFDVLELLTPAQIEDWLTRLAAAPK